MKRIVRDSIVLFVDYSKTFDKVDRRVLMELLLQRSKDATDLNCCNIIGMLNGTNNEYGTNKFDLFFGFLKVEFFLHYYSMSNWMKHSKIMRYWRLLR